MTDPSPEAQDDNYSAQDGGTKIQYGSAWTERRRAQNYNTLLHGSGSAAEQAAENRMLTQIQSVNS
ncbi:hypothetical protein IJT93_09990 [bacterium]|nr:hypothetical protein [bacterium]